MKDAEAATQQDSDERVEQPGAEQAEGLALPYIKVYALQGPGHLCLLPEPLPDSGYLYGMHNNIIGMAY